MNRLPNFPLGGNREFLVYRRYLSAMVYTIVLCLFALFGARSAHADPLAQTREILFECPPEEGGCEQGLIAQKAEALESVAAMYEYVRNTHEYALYHGSRSNTINTFMGQRGSDVDIASVLIAMYRSQNIPARYAKATVSAPAEDVANWIGVKNIELAAAIMDDQGIQNVNLADVDGTPTIEFEHAWVQVSVPFSDYRGAFPPRVDCSATPGRCQWIDVDPSWKLREFHNQNIEVYGVVDFDYDRYYHAIDNDDADYRDKGPLEIYEEQILTWLHANHPGKTLEDVADPGVIVPANDGLLPASLPYNITGAVTTYDSVSEHDDQNDPDWAKYLVIRYELGNFSFTGNISPPFILDSTSDPIALADLSTKRITLSYFEGSETAGDPFEHHQMTVRLDGQVIHTPILIAWQNDSDDFLGRRFNVTFELDGAPSTAGGDDHVIEATYQNLIFGGYYLIGTGGDTSNWSQVHRAAEKLLEANEHFPIINNSSGVPYVDKNGNGVINTGEPRLLDDPIAQDELTGGLLNVAMNQYFTRFVENTQKLDALNHVYSPMEGFVGIVSSTHEVDYLGSTAFSIMPGGLLIDMKGVRFNGTWLNDKPSSFANDHFELVGHEGSSLEHEIWQELTGFDAISTVRGIQMALASEASVDLMHIADASESAMTAMYSKFNYRRQVAAPWSYSLRDIYGTRPFFFLHNTNTGQEKVEVFKEVPQSSDNYRAAFLTYWNDFWGPNIISMVNCAENIDDLIAENGSGAPLNAGSLCGYSFSQGTTLGRLKNQFEAYYKNFFGVGEEGKYDFLDNNKGFSTANHVTLDSREPLLHEAAVVFRIRNALLFGGTIGENPARWEYTIPSRKTDTGHNLFSVYVEKIYDESDGSLASLGFNISNDTFLAGGGWVDGSINLSLADTGGPPAQPEFNNEIFTDKHPASVTNNDLVRTPSTVDPVSTVTGNMYHDETDFQIKGRGMSYVFTRTYNSNRKGMAYNRNSMGYGWTHSYNMHLSSNDYGKCPNCSIEDAPENENGIASSISYIDERGGEHTFILNSDSSSERRIVDGPLGEFTSLELHTPKGGQYTLTFANGVKYVFERVDWDLLERDITDARLISIADPYRNKLTMHYDRNGRLQEITDNWNIDRQRNSGLWFSYNESGRLSSVTDWSGAPRRHYEYDEAGNLIKAIDPEGNATEYTYHRDGHLLNEIIKPQGRDGTRETVAFSYYDNNKAFSYVNALGETEVLDYDLYRQRTRVTDPRGFVREHFYDKNNGALIKLKEPNGAVLQFENTEDGLRYKKRDAMGGLTQYSYQMDRSISSDPSDTDGLITREVDPLGNTIDYSYGLYGQVTAVTDKRGNRMTRTYYQTTDEAGDAVKGKLYEIRATVNGVENVLLERYTYYASGEAFGQIKQHIEFIDPSVPSRQRITHYTYKSDGINVQSKVVSGATSGGDITTTYTYDVLGRVLTETLHRRRSATDSSLMEVTTRYAYDDLDRVTKVTTPDGNIHENVYDDNGKVVEKKLHHTGSILSSECPYMSGHTVCTYAKNTYDAAGRLIKVTDVLGYSTSYTYDEMGNRLSETDPNGNTVRHEYDSMGRRTARIDANGHRFTFKYNLGGRLILATDPNGHSVRNTYDAMGRLIQVETEAGRVSQTTYDANGNITHVKDANAMADTGHPRNNEGATIYREYDELNRLVLERNALNGDTRYTYDLLGNVTSITDAEGQVTSFVYDDLGRLLETQDPVVEPGEDKTDRVLLYDEAGNPLLTEDRSGRRQRNSYDKMNRLVGADYLQDGSSYDWGYHGFGKLDLAGIDEEEEQKYYYQYTARYERKKMFDDRGGDIKDWIYSYDPAGNLATKTKPQGDVTTYQYDSMNRLVGMSNPEYLTASYHYDGAGRLIDRLLSNGAETHYQYDNDDRLIQLQNLSADGSAVEDLHYLYDHVGNIVQISDTASGRTVIYDYDALYRLVRVDSTNDAEDRAYSYDAVGNRRTEVRNGVTYHYCFDVDDCSEGPSGNRLMNIRVGSTNGPIYRQFKYDDSGRVTEKLDANGVPLYTVTYDGKGRASEINGKLFEYDHAGYRIRNGERLHYLEDEHLDSTYDLDGVLKNSYLRGVVVDELLNGFSYHSEDRNDRTNYTFHNDHLNSVSALTGHNGAVEERTTFDAFGMPLGQSMPGTENTLLYTGREYDRNSGLYYYRARYYDPEVGRFISEDPARFEGGINFYAYVGNNPINYNDPMGLVKWNDAFSSGLGMITSGAGVFVGGATAVGGGVMLGVPEPTLITKAAGVGAISFGTTTVAKSSFDFGLNFRNFVSAVRDQEPGVPSSGFELGAQVLFPGNQDAQLAAVSGNLMFDLASGRIPVGRIPDVVSAGSALARTKFANITEMADYSSANRAIGQLPVSIGSYGASDVSLGLSILQGSALAQTTLNNYGSVTDALLGGAGGGFVLYPGKPNTNLMQSAYAK